LDPPKGCPFNTRCPRHRGTICDTERPPQVEISSGHVIACHMPRDELEQMEPVIVQMKKDQPAAQ
jgi:peptide/nickel transport system ATP-binding protein